MAIFVLTRLARGLLIVFLTTTLTFFLIHAAPGEPLSGLLEDPSNERVVDAGGDEELAPGEQVPELSRAAHRRETTPRASRAPP